MQPNAAPTVRHDPTTEAMPFSCRVVEGAGAARVPVTGELDIATVPQLDRALRRAAHGASVVTLDLTGLEFTDSSGAHLLLEAHRRIRAASGRLLVLGGQPEVAWLLALLGVDRELEILSSATPSQRLTPPSPGR